MRYFPYKGGLPKNLAQVFRFHSNKKDSDPGSFGNRNRIEILE